ncbi:hemerythrin domain-containing protein [Pseudooceanicola aestuarii]|uniref:hemerythrin domain-containing protein n=1 Tax=Pseudooceanicola aestuarii TaxID=2697319 RepID=UPI0013D6C444|nr:hemerythrin domain-containing protein [Pseudooceanicola aestuarii]
MTDPHDPLSLGARTGLPDHLRVLAEKYPRTEWTGHPNFNELTAFWLERHLMFRQLIDTLIDGAQRQLDGNNARFGPEMSRYTGFFLNQLQHHHQIEDQHYFPRFIPLDNRLAQAFDILDHDHHALDHHIHALAENSNLVLTRLGEKRDASAATGRLLSAQTAFRGFLDRHLADEEEIIVPVILEYGAELE